MDVCDLECPGNQFPTNTFGKCMCVAPLQEMWYTFLYSLLPYFFGLSVFSIRDIYLKKPQFARKFVILPLSAVLCLSLLFTFVPLIDISRVHNNIVYIAYILGSIPSSIYMAMLYK